MHDNNNDSFVPVSSSMDFPPDKPPKSKGLCLFLFVGVVYFLLCTMGLRKPRHLFFIKESFPLSCGLHLSPLDLRFHC